MCDPSQPAREAGQPRARVVRRNTVPATMLSRRIAPWIRPTATMNSIY